MERGGIRDADERGDDQNGLHRRPQSDRCLPVREYQNLVSEGRVQELYKLLNDLILYTDKMKIAKYSNTVRILCFPSVLVALFPDHCNNFRKYDICNYTTLPTISRQVL